MARYRLNFKRIVYGFLEVEAKSKKEAIRKIVDDDCDIFDNKSEEIYDEDENGEYDVHLD